MLQRRPSGKSFAGQKQPTLVWGFEEVQKSKQCGLSSAAGAQNRQKLTFMNMQFRDLHHATTRIRLANARQT
jgi:hypothetical protein